MSHTRRWVIASIIFITLLMITWIRGNAQGGDIPYGQTVNASLKAGVTDSWHFIGNIGDIVEITAERASGDLEPSIILQDPAQQPVAGTKAGSKQGTASLLQVRIPQSGSYLILVSGDNNTTGDYKLTLKLAQAGIQTPTAEPTLNTNLVAGTINPGAQVRGEITNDVYRQLWRFHGNFGDVVDIRMVRLSGNLDSTLTLISPINDIVAANNSENGGPDAGILGLQLPYTGDYTIIARREGDNLGQNGTSTGQYELSYSSRGPDSASTNTALTPGLAMKGRMGDNAPVALYRLDVGGAVVLSLDLSSMHRLAQIRVLNTTGQVLLTEQGLSPFLLTTRLPDKGPFLVEATSISYEDVPNTDFTLTAYRLSANAARAATDPRPLSYGSRRTSTANVSDNWYFRGSTGDIISLNVIPGSVVDAKVRISGPQDVLLYQGNLGAGLQQSLTLAQNGLYEIEVRPTDEKIALPYSIALDRLGAQNNTFGLYAIPVDRGALTVDKPVTGKLDVGAVDAWWMDATAGQVINLTVSPTTGETSLGLTLFTPDGKPVEAQASDRVGGAVIDQVLLPQTGRYRVQVSDITGTHGGEYSLAYENATGGLLQAGQIAKGFAVPQNGYSIWAFDVAEGALINARLTSLTPQSWQPTVRIADPSGRIIASSQAGPGTDFKLVGVTAPTTGTYHLVVGAPVTGTFASYNVLVNVETAFGQEAAQPIQVNATNTSLVRYQPNPTTAPIRVSVADFINVPVSPNSSGTVPIPAINYGNTLRGEIAPGVFTEIWQFGTIQNQTFSLSATALSGDIGPDLTLFNQDGKLVHEQLHSEGATTVLTYSAPFGGIHRLVVRMGLNGGRYMLSLNSLPVTLGDVQVADGKAMVYGQTLQGELIKEAAEDRYYFLGTSNDVVSINLMRSTGDLLPGLTLIGPNGVEVATDHNSSNSPRTGIKGFKLQDDGIYTIVVARSDNGEKSIGTYLVSVTLDSNFRLNNRGGGLITPGQTVNGQLALPDNEDTWLFQGHAGERVTFVANGIDGALPAPLGLRLEDSGGHIFAAQDIGLTQSAVRLSGVMLPADGVYRVQVTGATDKAGLYQLTWLAQQSNTAIGAIRYNQTVNGIFHTEHNTDTWVFSGTAGDVISVALEYEQGTPFAGGFQLVYENGTALATVADVGNGLGARQEGILLPFSGSYTIYVANTDTKFKGTGIYSLSVNLQESKARSMGTLLNYGQRGEGTLYVDDATDTWTFTAKSGDTVKIAAIAQDQFLAPTIELRTPNGTLLATAQSKPDKQHAAVTIDNFHITADGVYAVTINGGIDRTTGSYLLSLDYAPPPLPVALTLNYGDTKEGLVADNRPRQIYPFSGREGDTVSAKVARESGANLNSVLTIETVDGLVLASAYSNGADTTEVVPFKLPRTDQYLLVVSRYLGAEGKTVGRFTVTLNGDIETRKIKGNVAYGKQAIGRLDNDTPVERINFTGKTGDVIGIVGNATSGDLDTQLVLENSAGAVLASNDDANGTNAAIGGVLLPTDDTYTVTISRVGQSSGNYELYVNRLYQVSQTTAPKALIAYGQRIVGTIDTTNTEARYTFTGNQDDEIGVQLIHQMDDAPPMLTIVDPANTVLASGTLTNGQTTIDSYKLPVDGLYTIVIKRPLDAKQSYNPFALMLTVKSVPTGRASGGGVLNLNDSVVGSFVPGKAAQYWLFEAKAGQAITVNLLKLTGDLVPSVILIAPNGEGLTSLKTQERQMAATLSQFALPVDGVYSLLVVPGAPNQSGQYRMTIQPNTVATVAPVTLFPGQTVVGTISATQPIQRWQVNVDANQSLTARLLVTDGTMVPTLQLLSPTGQVVAEGIVNRDLGIPGTKLTATLPIAGSYTVLVKADSVFQQDITQPGSGAASTYRLTMNTGDLSPQAVAAAALTFGQAVSKPLQQDAVDYWSFLGAPSDNIAVYVATDQNRKAPTIELQDQTGRVLVQSKGSDAADNNIETFIVPDRGSYVVALKGQESANYTLMVQQRQSLLIQNPPARPLPVGQALDGTLISGTPVNYFVIDAKAGEVLELDGARLDGNVRPDIAIFAPSGQAVISGIADRISGKLRLGPIRAAEDGKYMVVVSRWFGTANNQTGRFTVTLSKPTDVSGSDGGTIGTYGLVVTGGITSADPSDQWTFYGQAGEVIAMRATRTDGGLTPTLKLTGPDSKEIKSAEGKDTTASITDITLSTTGNYTITVGQAGNTTGGYNLVIDRLQRATQANVTTGEGIAFGEQKNGELTKDSPSKGWVFFGHAGERITASVEPAANSQLAPSLSIIAPDGSTLATDGGTGGNNAGSNAGGNKKSLIPSLLLPMDGFYGVVVTGSPSQPAEQQIGAFTVSLNRSQPGSVYQGTAQVGKQVESTLTADHPVHEWIFRAEQGKTIAASVTSSSVAFNTVISIVSQNGQLVAASTPAQDGKAAVEADLPGPGWYAVLVSANANGAQGRYQLAISYGLSPAGGGVIIDGQTVTGKIDNSDFTDTWRFEVTAATAVTIDVSRLSGDLDIDLAIYAPDGRQIPVQKTESKQIHVDSTVLADSGTYLLMVSRADGAAGLTNGTYQLKIASPQSATNKP